MNDEEKALAVKDYLGAIKALRERERFSLQFAKQIVDAYLRSIGRIQKVKIACPHCSGTGQVEVEERI